MGFFLLSLSIYIYPSVYPLRSLPG
jgi:hypothetical protein